MKVTVKPEELKKKLGLVLGISEKSSAMPILSHLLLSAGKEKSTITATDLTITVREPLEVVVASEGAICVPARKLSEIVREADQDITLETDETWLKIHYGRSKFKLACLPAQGFPEWPDIKGEGMITFTGALLVSLIERTIFSAGENDNRYTLNGLLFHFIPDKKQLAVVATDGHRMSLACQESLLEGSERKVIIPRKAAAEIRKFIQPDSSITCTVGVNHALFKIGEVDFLARLIEGAFPAYDQVVPMGNDKKIVVSREAFIKALRKTTTMASEGTRQVAVEVAGASMVVSSKSADIGEGTDEIEVEYGGDSFRAGFNAKYLLDAAAAFDTDKITLSMGTPLSPALITNNGDRNFLCVVMPMKL